MFGPIVEGWKSCVCTPKWPSSVPQLTTCCLRKSNHKYSGCTHHLKGLLYWDYPQTCYLFSSPILSTVRQNVISCYSIFQHCCCCWWPTSCWSGTVPRRLTQCFPWWWWSCRCCRHFPDLRNWRFESLRRSIVCKKINRVGTISW